MKIKTLSDVPSVDSYLRRIGAEVRSLKTAVVREVKGEYWKDIATIKFERDGSVKAAPDYEPTPSEAVEIERDLTSVEWPQLKPITRLTDQLPEAIEQADKENVFEFRNMSGQIVMLQLRTGHRGQNKYLPFTYWDDDTWRRMEPEGPLPIWGIEQLKQYSTVFIHEGAKAARFCHSMVQGETFQARDALKAHPWGEELSDAAHLGWIGGALNPHRTDWSQLNRMGVKRAYIVSDNDAAGIAAVPHISYHLKMPTFHVQFTDDWDQGFDLADQWPDKFFETIEERRYYKGPAFRACLHPATWATDLVPNPKGKPTTVLRDNFKELWSYVEEADSFVCIEMPEILRSEAVANKIFSSFSHSSNTTQLLVKNYRGRATKLCYRPDISGRIVTDRSTSAINLHTPTHVKSAPGSVEPFIEFTDYLFPDEEERREVLRWCATLMARPDIRMEYGLLLVSETQGVGKTTLGSAILAPLIGLHNVGYPTEADIVNSDFNGWLANKRLVIVNEIYSGHSWKAYNRLKTFITDPEVNVNQKYQRPYVVENWCHVFACSNSLRALKMEEDDRRWFYPEVTEARWPRERFVKLHQWVRGGGLSIIKNWAENFGDYVMPGQRAPMTRRKRELIDDSRSDAQKEVSDLARQMCSFEEPMALAMKSVEGWVRTSIQGRVFDTDYELRKAMREAGAKVFKKRIKVAGRMQYVVLNDALLMQVNGSDDDEAAARIRGHLKAPTDILGTNI